MSPPRWTASPKHGLTQWYGHVHLLRDLVVGQWFATRRTDGTLVWEQRHPRANTVRDISEANGVILATETRSDGPWTADFGCYAISLETGELLWCNHGRGAGGGLLRILDFVPGFTNEFRDTACAIRDGQCLCESGRLLDLHSGEPLGQLSRKEVEVIRQERMLARAEPLYHSGEVDLPDLGLRVSNHTRVVDGGVRRQRGTLRLETFDENGASRWNFDIAATKYHIDGNFYSYRLISPYIYLVVSEAAQRKVHPKRPHTSLPNASPYHILVLDIRSGELVQDTRIQNAPCETARIEDVDDAGLLIGVDGKTLFYFELD
ncbi:MAG: hypothetical protein KJ060_02160 [Candidatus Hydrogenedentes bacterium]|nr:hypothetical protein [Candidatus Hydrogenedentota bacterium]